MNWGNLTFYPLALSFSLPGRVIPHNNRRLLALSYLRNPVARNLMNMIEQEKNQSPTEDEIAACAFLIWEQEGRPENMHDIHWWQALAQLSV